MRKERKFSIENHEKQYEVYELSVKQIINLIEEDALGDLSLSALRTVLSDRLLPMASNLSLDELLGMYPSEIEFVWTKFREVNASFFAGIEILGLTSIMNTLKKALINDFSRMLVDLSSQGTSES